MTVIARNSLLLLTLWIILSWQFAWFLMVLGLLSSIALALAQNKLPYSRAKSRFKIIPLSRYSLWLIWQIIISATYVTKKVWKLKIDINTSKENFIIVHKKQKDNFASAIFANSVTLTPGSATLLLEDDKYYVHCLTSELKSGVLDIERKVSESFE